MDVGQALLFRYAQSFGVGFVENLAEEDDACAVAFRGCDFGQWGLARHDDRGFNA